MTGPHPVDLEPSRLPNHTYLSRRRIGRIDAAWVLTAMLALAFLIPPRFLIPGLTDLGRPALVLGLLMAGWWMLVRFNPRLVLVGPQPLRWAVLAYVCALFASYAVGYLRGLTTMEANGADRAMLTMAAFIGVILAAADGLANWDRLRLVLEVLVWGTAVIAVIGLLETALLTDLTPYLHPPGLVEKGEALEFQARGSGLRVASTTTHFIEFSVVLAMALPFAIHFARFSSRYRAGYRVAAVLIAAAIPTAISRTGLVAAAIAVALTMLLWGWRLRYNIAVSALAVAAVLVVFRPTLVDTFVELFTGANRDSSITARLARYELVAYYFNESPILGRGTGTWIWPQYQFLDNQWLAQALTTGVVGVAALATLHLTGLSLAYLALSRSTSPDDRHLCAALISVQLVAIFAAAAFDSMSFSTYLLVLALLTGCCGTVWRFTHPARQVRTAAVRGLERNLAPVGDDA